MILMDNKTWLVSIILLNYNWKQFNSDCIDSILKQTYHDYEIIFVDNKSTDWSLEDVEKCYKKEIESWKIKIVKNCENLWFAWWNNSWVRESSKDSKYIWLLNNDTVVEVDSIFKSDVQMMEKVAPYKAAKIDLLGLEKIKNSPIDDDVFKPIPRQESIESKEEIKNENQTQNNNSMFVE